MQSVAAVYNRIERAAMRHDRRPLYDWMARRTDNAVKEAIKHGLRMANDPDYRLGVEAYRFAREYEEAFDTHSGGMGAFSLDTEQKQWVNALREGALRLRAGIDTDASAVATRREVERLLGVMRAELDALRAPAPRFEARRVDGLWRVWSNAENQPFDLNDLPTDLAEALGFASAFGWDESMPPLSASAAREVAAALNALRAPAPPPVAPVPVAPTGFGVEYPRDPTMYIPFPGWDSAHDGYKIDGSKVLFWAKKEDAKAAARSLGWPLDSVAKVHTNFQNGWALVAGRFGLVSRVWLAHNLFTSFPVQGFAASTLDAEADGLRDDPGAEPLDEDDAAIRAVVRAYEAGKRKALVVSRAESGDVIAGLTILANTEDEHAEAERKRPVSKRDPERARMTRAASDGLSALATRISQAFR